MDLISKLISTFNPSAPNFRPTELYNESWLIKIVLHQTSSIINQDSQISFLPESTWFSEGLLPTAFQAMYKGDKLSESRTNADGVIGHIKVGEKAKADLELAGSATQFTVVEAKIGSPLAKGITNAPRYDQAARNVACMAEVIARAGIDPKSLHRLDFIVLAPQYAIDKGTFKKDLDLESINSKVKKRVSTYDGQLDDWFIESFEPTLNNINIKSLSWESAIKWISLHKTEIINELQNYYDLCLRYK